MAYMNQEKKKALAPNIKATLKKFGMKGSISVLHHSALVVTITEGPLDIIGDYVADRNNKPMWGREVKMNREDVTDIDVNTYHIDEHYSNKVAEFLNEIHAAMQSSDDGEVANHDRSDIQSDYFDVGWYNYIRVGKWNKPYVCTGELEVKEAVAA